MLKINESEIDWDNASMHLLPNGYYRLQYGGPEFRVRKFLHVHVWEKHNGKLPDGYQVHHINKIKTDNRIENLQAVTELEHRRIHAGYLLIDNEYYKICTGCNETLKIEMFYKSKLCKDCFKKYAKEYYKSKIKIKPKIYKERDNGHVIINEIECKPCSKCAGIKPVTKEYFVTDNAKKSGFAAICKNCSHYEKKQRKLKNKIII